MACSLTMMKVISRDGLYDFVGAQRLHARSAPPYVELVLYFGRPTEPISKVDRRVFSYFGQDHGSAIITVDRNMRAWRLRLERPGDLNLEAEHPLSIVQWSELWREIAGEATDGTSLGGLRIEFPHEESHNRVDQFESLIDASIHIGFSDKDYKYLSWIEIHKGK